METLIDPFEIGQPFSSPPALAPMRAPMMTMSVEVDFEWEDSARPSEPDLAPDSWSRVRCWCSED